MAKYVLIYTTGGPREGPWAESCRFEFGESSDMSAQRRAREHITERTRALGQRQNAELYLMLRKPLGEGAFPYPDQVPPDTKKGGRLNPYEYDPKSGHMYFACYTPCPSPGTCQFCDGGLKQCQKCHEAEGGLAATCPGPKQA